MFFRFKKKCPLIALPTVIHKNIIKGESFKLQMTTCMSTNVIQGTIELIYDGWFYFRHNLF